MGLEKAVPLIPVRWGPVDGGPHIILLDSRTSFGHPNPQKSSFRNQDTRFVEIANFGHPVSKF